MTAEGALPTYSGADGGDGCRCGWTISRGIWRGMALFIFYEA